MEQLELSDPDLQEEFMKGNFCINKNDIPFCAIGPDDAIGIANKIMRIQGGLKALTQQPAALARWFLIAPELSRLAAEAETLVGIQTHCSTYHHDLSTAVISRFAFLEIPSMHKLVQYFQTLHRNEDIYELKGVHIATFEPIFFPSIVRPRPNIRSHSVLF